MDTSPRNRQVNPMGPMGSSSGTGPLGSTWEDQHSVPFLLPYPLCQNCCRCRSQLWPARSLWSQAHKAQLSSHTDLVPVEVWHGFGISRFLLTRRPSVPTAVAPMRTGLTSLWGGDIFLSVLGRRWWPCSFANLQPHVTGMPLKVFAEVFPA